MLGILINLAIFMLSCMGVYRNLDKIPMMQLPGFNHSSSKYDLEQYKLTNATRRSTNNVTSADENRIHPLPKFSIKMKQPTLYHSNTKRLIAVQDRSDDVVSNVNPTTATSPFSISPTTMVFT
jgi:hypothetical protein